MTRHTLIDLYYPAHQLDAEALKRGARKARLDAAVIVAESPEDLPDDDEIAELTEATGLILHRGCVIAGAGFRVLVLGEAALDEGKLDAIEAAGDLELVQAAVHELSACAVPICPRQGVEEGVNRQVVPLPADPPVGIVAMVAGGSRLGRDLDIEDAAAMGRRVLAATGPFGKAADFGRYATFLPADPSDLDAIIDALDRGQGIGVELGGRKSAKKGQQARGDGEQGKKKKRRRRRRRKKSQGNGQPAAAG